MSTRMLLLAQNGSALGLPGKEIQRLRQARGLSLRALAQRSGVNVGALSRWESEKRAPRIPELEAVLRVLEATEAQTHNILRQMDAPRALARLRSLDQSGTDAYAYSGSGDLLWALRQRKGWTQAMTASAVHVTQAQVARWEKGDAWPDSEKLHALCHCLGAFPDEVAALTTGGQWGARTIFQTDIEQEQWSNSEWVDNILWILLTLPPTDLFDLTLIATEQNLKRVAATDTSRHDFAVSLLADTYALHARHHLYYGKDYAQLRQAMHWAERGLALIDRRQPMGSPPKIRAWQSSLWFGNVLTWATFVSYSKRPAGVRKAIRLLQKYLPALEPNDPHYAWGRMVYATMLMSLGYQHEALAIGQKISDAIDFGGPGDGFMRCRELAQLLLQCNKPDRALKMLERGTTLIPLNRVGERTLARHRLLEAECYESLGDRQSANERARAAEAIVVQHDLTFLQTELSRVCDNL